MIEFEEIEEEIIFKYTPENGIRWILERFQHNKSIYINKIFYFEKNDLYKEIDLEEIDLEEEILFSFAKLENDYFRVNKNVIGIDQELLIHHSIKFKLSMFKTSNNISIFRKVFNVVGGDLSIGPNESDLPLKELNRLLKIFPNSTELKKYSHSRISHILKEYVSVKKDFLKEYNLYMSNKSLPNTSSLITSFAKYEVIKYQNILHHLKDMLKDEIGYSEAEWQSEIIDILILIYPKYIAICKEVEFKDTYNSKKRRLDYMLVDSNGNIDIVEIKKPNTNSLISTRTYRDNYIPIKELSGTIMQVEKYLFHLNKSGKQGELELTKKYKKCLPDDFSINITNPSAILILGKENELSIEQLRDLEIIKRKYKNVIDIVTYDDLIRRLERIIQKFESQTIKSITDSDSARNI
ncbi:Shedu immune nuclease family protein [Paenibacillus kyungheensis]